MWRDEIAQARKKENNSECRPFPGVVAGDRWLPFVLDSAL